MVNGSDCDWPELSETEPGSPLTVIGLGALSASVGLTAVFPDACIVSVALTLVPGVTALWTGVIDMVMPCTAGTVKDSVAVAVTDGLLALVTLSPKLSGVPGGAIGVEGTAQTPMIAVAPAGIVADGRLVWTVKPAGTLAAERLNVSVAGPVF